MNKKMEKIEIVHELEHPNLARLAKIETEDNQMFCANFSNVNLCFEYYENNLL